MAKPQRLPSGKWRVQFFDAYGERQSKTFESRAVAEQVLRTRQTEADKIREGLVKPLSDKTFQDAITEWIETRPVKRRHDDEGRLRVHILPFLGEYKLPDIGQDVLKRFVRHLEGKKKLRNVTKFVDGERKVDCVPTGETLKPMTIKNCLILTGKILSDLGYPQRIKYKVPTSGYAWIANASDVGRFLAECTTPWFHTSAALAVYAGLRKGEVAGLRRDAIDFDRGLMRIDCSYDGPVKSKHMRWVPLAPALASILKAWLLQHAGELVVTVNGRPITEDTNLPPYVARACTRANLPRINFHQLRHTAASHLAQRVPLPLVGAVLGHADPKTTARYAHLDTEGVARDPRLHLNFEEPSGRVLPFAPPKRNVDGTAHQVHTAEKGRGRAKKT